jgi:protein-S-isoprenylcysteine O-methyltransferase Ste14
MRRSTSLRPTPYGLSRHPLYLGWNVFIFFIASVPVKPGGLALTVLHLPVVDFMIEREERQLEQAFGDAWREYARRARWWI